MAEKNGIVIIDADDNARQFVRELVKGIETIEFKGEAVDLALGYELVRQHNPEIVMLDLHPSVDLALQMAERIMQYSPQTVLFITSYEGDPQTIIKSMRAGAREFLSKPLRKEELDNALKTAVRILNRITTGEGHKGKLISVFGVKGGVGVTAIAVNLAVGLAERSKEVILVDLNLQSGNTAHLLNIRPGNAIIDVARNIDDINQEGLRHSLPRHSSGLSLLAGSSQVEDAATLHGSELESIITLLRSMFDFIVMDIPNTIDDLTLKALDLSDTVLTVFTGDIPSLANAIRYLDVFRRLKYDENKVLPVLNRFDNHTAVTVDEIQKSLKYPLFWKIPNQDYSRIIDSINMGIPLISSAPNSLIGQSIKGLANRLNGGDHAENENGKLTARKSLLKKLLFRKQSH